MAASRTTFEKLQRDRAKQAKAAAKRAKRLEKNEPQEEEDTPVDLTVMPEGEEMSAGQLLQLVEKLHKQFDDEVISFEEFEDQKTELMARLTIE